MMKRIFALLMAGAMLTLPLFAGCEKKEAEQTTPALTTPAATTDETASKPLLPADGVLSCTRDGDLVSVNVTLAEGAGAEASLIVLTDPAYRHTWSENADACLSDLGQIKLDEAGNGTLTLKLKNGTSAFWILLTAPCGAYALEVN